MKRKRRPPRPPLSSETIAAAVQGPQCNAGCGVRTRNPSGRCTTCLGPRACVGCFGTGVIAGWWHLACPACPGTGLAPSLAATDVCPSNDKMDDIENKK